MTIRIYVQDHDKDPRNEGYSATVTNEISRDALLDGKDQNVPLTFHEILTDQRLLGLTVKRTS